jgi:hypothetical protein
MQSEVKKREILVCTRTITQSLRDKIAYPMIYIFLHFNLIGAQKQKYIIPFDKVFYQIIFVDITMKYNLELCT